MYFNALQDKKLIYKDNYKKSGIYKWTNLINGKSYIGSSVNLYCRFRDYYSFYFINKSLKRGNSMIYNAILKYKHNNFSLEILEYCDNNILLEREQYYIDLLNPEYNICKTAGSVLGRIFSNETKLKISSSLKKIHAKDTRTKKSSACYCKIGHLTFIVNNTNNTVKVFISLNAASKYINCDDNTIKKYINKPNFFKEPYTIFSLKGFLRNLVTVI